MEAKRVDLAGHQGRHRRRREAGGPWTADRPADGCGRRCKQGRQSQAGPLKMVHPVRLSNPSCSTDQIELENQPEMNCLPFFEHEKWEAFLSADMRMRHDAGQR